MNTKCFICKNEVYKKNLCIDHFNQLNKLIKKNLIYKKTTHDYTSHYHNLRFSIIKMCNIDHIKENILRLIAIAEAFSIKFNNSLLVEKAYVFSKNKILVSEQYIKKIMRNMENFYQKKITKKILEKNGQEIFCVKMDIMLEV